MIHPAILAIIWVIIVMVDCFIGVYFKMPLVLAGLIILHGIWFSIIINLLKGK